MRIMRVLYLGTLLVLSSIFGSVFSVFTDTLMIIPTTTVIFMVLVLLTEKEWR